MPQKKEWTLMFYMASDNPLAPGVVSQLKAIKNAGFHPDANVITQFDPYVEGTPTHIFEVNLINKLKQPGIANVGFQGNDPFVRNLVEDKLWREQKTRKSKPVKSELRRILQQNHGLEYEAGTPPEDRLITSSSRRDEPEEPDPQESLRRFLNFCVNKYPARHYALFILGHGVVVGNDVFLFDEHASRHALSLTELGTVLGEFKTEIDDDHFELVSFHSCSVSSVEVAYELQNTANYMLASQGPAFVGSWPYRAIIIRVFNDLVRHGKHIPVKRMLERIFKYCFFNAVDFLMAGYSFQLTLLDLRRIGCIKEPVDMLVDALIDGLKDKPTRDLILLAHLKSQSFYQEMYTDLYDFCFCLSNKIKNVNEPPCDKKSQAQTSEPPIPPQWKELYKACGKVMDALMKEHPHHAEEHTHPRIIISAEFLGPSYQYSRGLSVYFPWTRPVGDRRIMAEYRRYKFHQDFDRGNQKSWLDFLDCYFDKTLRCASSQEEDCRRTLPNPGGTCPHQPPCPKRRKPVSEPDPCAPPSQTQPAPPDPPSQCQKEQEERELREDIANLIYGEGPLLGDYELAGGDKSGPRDPTGGSNCDCPSIKNYPQDTRARRERVEKAVGGNKEEPRVEVTQADFL